MNRPTEKVASKVSQCSWGASPRWAVKWPVSSRIFRSYTTLPGAFFLCLSGYQRREAQFVRYSLAWYSSPFNCARSSCKVPVVMSQHSHWLHNYEAYDNHLQVPRLRPWICMNYPSLLLTIRAHRAACCYPRTSL